jgi:hypothetical protein
MNSSLFLNSRLFPDTAGEIGKSGKTGQGARAASLARGEERVATG